MTCWWENGNYQNCCILHRQQKRVGEMTCEYQNNIKDHAQRRISVFHLSSFPSSYLPCLISLFPVSPALNSLLLLPRSLMNTLLRSVPSSSSRCVHKRKYDTSFVKDDLHWCPRSTVSSNLISRTRKARLRPSSLTQRRKARSPVVRVPRLMPP